MKLPNDTRIAREKTVLHWTAMRNRLVSGSDSAAWTEAFKDFFQARLESRYFEPIRKIAEIKKDVGAGFAIVALHCSLIEFLGATLQGKTFRIPKKAEPLDDKLEYGKSGEMFVFFLENAEPFKSMFSKAGTASEFYESVRNGLLHDARTKGRWKIRVCETAKQAIDVDAKVVYRDKMQEAFDQFIDWYGQQLLTDAELQQAFVRKFDSVCSV